MTNNKKKLGKLLVSLFMVILIYFTLHFQKYLDYFNILYLVIFFIVGTYIYKSNLFDKEYRKISLSLASIFSILFLLGRICYNFRYNSTYNIWIELFQIKSILYLSGYFSLFYPFFINILPKVNKINIFEKFKLPKKVNIFLLATIIIFICWLPYFIIYYPGLFTGDSISELTQIINNFTNLSDHHTVIHILLSAIPFKIGMHLFNNINIAASLIIICQMMIMATIFGSVISFLYKRGVSKKILLLILLYFAIVPIHAFYSITMWKDIIFSGCVLLLTMELIKLLEKKQITYRNSYSFIIVSVLTIFFRNNAIYMYLLLTIISIFIFKKQRKVILSMFLIIFLIYGIVKGPIFNYFGIKKSKSTEYIAIPLQQVGRMAYKNVTFTKNEKKLINEVIPLETLKKVYNAEIVDSIKFDKSFKIEAFEKQKTKYLNMWISLCLKHFDIATEAYLISTLGYWYPNIDYWTVVPRIDKNNINLSDNSLVPSKVKKLSDSLITKKIPIYGFIWSIGLCIWIIIISIAMIIKSKNKKILYVFCPVIGIWLTMLVATPVFAEFRYIYCAYTCLPLLLLSNKLLSKTINKK